MCVADDRAGRAHVRLRVLAEAGLASSARRAAVHAELGNDAADGYNSIYERNGRSSRRASRSSSRARVNLIGDGLRDALGREVFVVEETCIAPPALLAVDGA